MDFTPGHSQPHHLHHQSQQLPQPGPHPQDQQNQQNEQNQHQHHYHANGLPTSGASRCPALHPAFPHHSYQLPAPTAQSSAHYGPPALNSREAYWQARSRHTWLPNSLPDGFPMDSSQGQHAFLNQTNPSNQMQPRLPCPAPITNVADMSGPSYMLQRHYTAMHPPPHFPSLNQAGYDSLNWRQPDGQLHPNRYGHGANSAFPNQGPARFGPLSQRSSAVPSPTTGPRRIFVSDENTRPAAIPSLLTDAAADADSTNSMSQHAPGHSEPAAETRVAVDADNPLPASPSASMPISAAPEQPNHHITERVDENANVQASHIENPVQVHRLAFANTSRPRRATSSRSAAGYEMAIRAGGLELLDFADGHQGIYSDWEGPRFNVSLGKKLASRRALETLLSVDIASLPASERTCVICYNEFGVASPEGTNEAPLKLPKCKHVFGDHCIKKWFEESDTCPYCRDKVYQPTLRGPYPWQYLQRSYLSDHHIGSFRGIARGQGQSRSQGTQTQTQIQQLLSLSRAHDQNVPEQGFAELGRIIPEFSSPDPIFDDSMRSRFGRREQIAA
ncbi:hypothetical protein GGS20DRAFT_222180 [Poronia punctata]|nr:hypothetical protein GGS20DRAFT_222180 [Poronia punctata]